MKYYVFNFVLLLSGHAFAIDAKNVVLELKFDKKGYDHIYQVEQVAEKYVLHFTDEKMKIKKHNLSSNDYKNISYKANQIIWENLYRKPASIKKCLTYATLKNDFGSTLICQQNVKTTANTFALLNSLNQFFK
jgi:hypothetical protein